MKENYKWHVFYIVTIFILVFIQLYQALMNEKTPAKPKGIGHYVYMDKSNTLHTTHGCAAVYKIPNTNQQPVRRKKKDELTREHMTNICSRCVTDIQYDLIRAAVLVNEGNGVFYDEEEDN